MNTALNSETNESAQDKVARYGWTIQDGEGQFIKINKRLLNVNREVYQRDGIKSKAIELAGNWSWIACGALVVAQRDNAYWVIDGQHRKIAADRRSDIQELPCLVFHVADVKEEARGFLATNTNRRNVSALDKYRARLAADDPAALNLQRAIDLAGLRITNTSNEPRAFKSVAAGLKIAENDFDGLISVLILCGKLATAEKCHVHARLLSGLYYIHRRVDGGVECPRLSKRILQIGAQGLVASANKAAAYYGLTGGKVCAEGMMKAINNGLQNKFAMVAP